MTRGNIQQWSYSGKPGSSQKDEVRFLIGDTDPKDKQLDDCEVEYLIAVEGSSIGAAICACIGIIALYSRDFDGKFGDSTSAQISANYVILLEELRRKRDARPYIMFAGGLSRSQKLAVEQNTDRVRPVFTKTMGNNPRTLEPNGNFSGIVE